MTTYSFKGTGLFANIKSTLITKLDDTTNLVKNGMLVPVYKFSKIRERSTFSTETFVVGLYHSGNLVATTVVLRASHAPETYNMYDIEYIQGFEKEAYQLYTYIKKYGFYCI